ncbi:alpha/beta fold hydrolase [Planotetraspora kaengkrachanensis]|uniref:Alpha/beta hydrolase n=2 Tax=Planotetraspora kaengkrachanensis TaxID=575193 RepID=A0A8J3VB03_9ACTN|nr:alpha/beta hydrolase [Planotetraspora kaengkrachanensis]
MWAAAGMPLLSVIALGSAGWYFSRFVIDPAHTSEYPLEVTAVDGDLVTLEGGTDTAAPGTYGLTWADGNALLGAVVSTGVDTVTRKVESVSRGTLRPGVRAHLDRSLWGRVAPSAVDVPYREVTVPSPLGGFPAWQTEGTSSTWVIAVHGRNGDAAEALRVLPTLRRLGMPVLGITYRNDAGAPAGPDGKLHLGASEWEDLAAAVTYAKDQGATSVVLYGWSMGGSIVPMAVRRLPDEPIAGMILDSPVLDWRSPIAYGGRQMGVPAFLVSVADWVIERRTGLSFDDLDHVRHAGDFSIPALIFVDADDGTVPVEPALEFARVRPDLVTLVQTKDGGHTGSWNVDPEQYEGAVRTFVSGL